MRSRGPEDERMTAKPPIIWSTVSIKDGGGQAAKSADVRSRIGVDFCVWYNDYDDALPALPSNRTRAIDRRDKLLSSAYPVVRLASQHKPGLAKGLSSSRAKTEESKRQDTPRRSQQFHSRRDPLLLKKHSRRRYKQIMCPCE